MLATDILNGELLLRVLSRVTLVLGNEVLEDTNVIASGGRNTSLIAPSIGGSCSRCCLGAKDGMNHRVVHHDVLGL